MGQLPPMLIEQKKQQVGGSNYNTKIPPGSFKMFIYLKEGLRIFKRARYVRKYGFKQYKGNAKEICEQIVKDCWNGQYFKASNGHFCQFWTRDFGFYTESLINLGYKEEVKKTLKYALSIFSKYSKVTTTITPNNKPYDFPYYAPDSLAYLIRSLRISNSIDLIKKYREFLNKEIHKFHNIVLDKDTGLVRKDKRFSSMKDFSIRKSSCYDNCCVAMLNNELKKIKILENPFKKYNFEKIIKDNFWINGYFIDDLSGNNFITGDANVFPFYFEIFTDKKMMKSSITKIQEIGLDKPFPLRYSTDKLKMILLDKILSNYEGNTIWCHLGSIYIKTVCKFNKNLAEYYLNQYTKLIEKNKNFIELFFPNGKPYSRFWYYADEGMLWASIILEMINK